MVMSLERFCKCMKHIQEQMAKDDILTDLMVCEDTTGWVSTAPYLIDDLLEFIEEDLNDVDGWISWYLWEIDEDRKNNHVWDRYMGKDYKFTINDTEDLYYLITNQMDNIKEKVEEAPPEEGVFEERKETTLYDIFMANMNGYTESNN